MSKKEENKEMDVVQEVEQEVDEKAKAAEERRVKRNEAKDRLREAMKEALNAKAEEVTVKVADLELAVGMGRKAKTTARRYTVLGDLLENYFDKKEVGGVAKEFDIFKGLHLGAPSMGIQIANAIKKPAPEDRVWIKYFRDEGEYRIMGMGPNPPEGWDGYLPADMQEL